jgi:hypothetical protein
MICGSSFNNGKIHENLDFDTIKQVTSMLVGKRICQLMVSLILYASAFIF